MVNWLIALLPLSPVITSITPIPLKGKVILKALAWAKSRLYRPGPWVRLGQAVRRPADPAQHRRGGQSGGHLAKQAIELDEVPEFQVAYQEARRAAAATTLLKVRLDQGPRPP